MTDQEFIQTERGSPHGNDYLSEIIKGVMGASGIDQSPTKPSESVNASEKAAPTTDLFSALLSNPELLSKLPTIISTIKPIIEMLSAQKNAPTDAAVPVSLPKDNETAISTSSPSGKSPLDRRAALLCAMKPYLSHDRCEAIDYIIKLSRLGDILKTL